MPFIYNKHFTATVIGGRLVEVTCEKCRCEFAYELIRVGKGESDALYGVGQQSASGAAVERSQLSLYERLATEAELVPCPKCHWINEALVAGFRLGRYRRLLPGAVGTAMVALGVSLIAVWFLAIGPEQDRWLVPYVLVCSAGGGGGLVLVAWAVRRWLRHRIQPNANYPSLPPLPPGTPRVFLKNAATGEYEPGSADLSHGLPPARTVTLQIGTWSEPTRCCSCLQVTPPDQHYAIPVLANQALKFPYCSGCARRRRWQSFRLATAAFVVLVLGAAGLSWFLGGRDDFAWLFALSALACVAAAAAFGHLRTVPVTIRVLDEGRGLVRLWFRNPDFIAEFDPERKKGLVQS